MSATMSSPSSASSTTRRARSRSLRAQLRLGFGALAVALALLAIAAVAALDHLGGAVDTILRENYDSVVACEDMKEALERQDSAALFSATGRHDIAAPMLQANRGRFDEAFSRERRNITLPGEGELVREIDALYQAYESDVDRALALPDAARLDAYFRRLLPGFTAIKDRVQAVLRLNQENMEAADREARALARRTNRIGIAVSAVAVLLAAWLAYRLPGSVTRPLEALTRSAGAIGEGRLDVSVEVPETTELAALAAAFNRMAERLRAYRDSSLGELLAAKDLARATLACMVDPVVVLDRAGGVLLANEAAEAAFDVRIGSAEELRSHGATLPAEVTDARDRVLETGEAVLPRSLSEAVHRRTSEGERYYLVRALPLRVAPGDAPSAIVLAQDVTRLRRIDDLKSDMVATVSHQFKTPLTSLRMATHLLLETGTGELTEAQHELVVTARDDTERLRTMVEELLDVVRIDAEAGALHRVPIEPHGLLYEVVEAHRAIARDKGVTLEVGAAASLGLVSVDPERMSIALANLVSNAIRHTPAGGRVQLDAAQVDGKLKIDVTDTGEGIGPELLPLIFDRTVTASAREGDPRRHGLGLAIAREIVLQHGGELRATSEPGRGSTFTMLLPAAADS